MTFLNMWFPTFSLCTLFSFYSQKNGFCIYYHNEFLLSKIIRDLPLTKSRSSFSIFTSLTCQDMNCSILHSLKVSSACFLLYYLQKPFTIFSKALSSATCFSLTTFSSSLNLANVIGSSSIARQWFPNW